MQTTNKYISRATWNATNSIFTITGHISITLRIICIMWTVLFVDNVLNSAPRNRLITQIYWNSWHFIMVSRHLLDNWLHNWQLRYSWQLVASQFIVGQFVDRQLVDSSFTRRWQWQLVASRFIVGQFVDRQLFDSSFTRWQWQLVMNRSVDWLYSAISRNRPRVGLLFYTHSNSITVLKEMFNS